ncbi:DUF4124 domain-containing protein [Frateuria defendens]|uniref:DUF4124 domain-containing protein n=1 Tax=Frateuria defendens TaxID=2219559 RepID=UPI00066FFDB5|nr:DUF4124 domain-containing protein [Frateuria defendens]
MRCFLLPMLLWLTCAMPAVATTVYKCTAADGRVVYQDAPCARGQRQQRIDLPAETTAAPPPAAPATPEAPPAPSVPPPSAAPPEPAAPLPVLYTCVRATDGKSYLSENGNPAPYLVPLGMLDWQHSLSQAYGPDRGGGGISAPEANRGRVTPGMVSGAYTWAQDSCRLLGPQETCQALRDAYDENARKLGRAFKSDRPPLERRDAELRAQLRGC